MMAAKTRRKHSRVNQAQRDNARRLVAVWYADRRDRREERYRAVNSKPVMLQGPPRVDVERWPEQPWDRPVTADGVETKPPPRGAALGHAMNVDAAGQDVERSRELVFATKVMRHVINIEPASHCALEMDAAGYSIEGIADELGCGERLARDFLGDGLAVVRSCVILRRDLGW